MALVLYSGLCGCHWPSSSFLPVWMHTGFKKIQNIVNNNSLDSNGLQVWIFSLVFLCCVKCTYCNLWAKNIFILDHSNHREFQNLHVFLFNAVVWRTRSSDSSTLFCLSAWYFVVSAKISWKIPMTASNQTSNVQSYPIHDTGSLFIAGIALVNLRTWRRPAACALLVSNLVPALYTGLLHQRGTLDVIGHLQTLCDDSDPSTPPLPEVLFLMPCHSTPFYR